MADYLNCKKIDTAINRGKKKLTDRAKQDGVCENFGQIEVREIREKFIDICDYSIEMNINRKKLNSFENWCMEYVIS